MESLQTEAHLLPGSTDWHHSKMKIGHPCTFLLIAFISSGHLLLKLCNEEHTSELVWTSQVIRIGCCGGLIQTKFRFSFVQHHYAVDLPRVFQSHDMLPAFEELIDLVID